MSAKEQAIQGDDSVSMSSIYETPPKKQKVMNYQWRCCPILNGYTKYLSAFKKLYFKVKTAVISNITFEMYKN